MTEPAAAPVAPTRRPTLLEIAGLDAFYGKARVLDDLSFTMERGSLAIVGRNGMGKTTLCNAIMGIAPPHAEGSIRFEGKELVGGQSHKIARHGIGYVPQGRRLFPSLTVDEHLRIASRSAAGARRAASGRASGSTSSSRGSPSEAQRRRAALGRRAADARDRARARHEPAPGRDGRALGGARACDHREHDRDVPASSSREGLSLLLIEQNLGVATSLAERQLIMVAGSDRDRDDRGSPSPATPSCSGATSAWNRSPTSS